MTAEATQDLSPGTHWKRTIKDRFEGHIYRILEASMYCEHITAMTNPFVGHGVAGGIWMGTVDLFLEEFERAGEQPCHN